MRMFCWRGWRGFLGGMFRVGDGDGGWVVGGMAITCGYII